MAEKHKHRIDWVSTAAGALAAMSSAVLLSTLGAAGTLLGAALGSALVSIGSSVYGHGLARSRERVAALPWAAREAVGVAHVGVPGGSVDDALVAVADQDPPADWLDEPGGGSPLRERLAQLPWKRVAVAAAGLFAVSVMAITAFELVAGQPVSSFTGGGDSGGRSSIGGLTGGSGDRDPDRSPEQSQLPQEGPAGVEVSPMGGAPSPEPSVTPSQEASVTPSPDPALPSPTSTPVEPETSPSPMPSTEPTASPSAPDPVP